MNMAFTQWAMTVTGFWWLNGCTLKVIFFRLNINFILSAVTLASSYKVSTGIYAKYEIPQIKIVI